MGVDPSVAVQADAVPAPVGAGPTWSAPPPTTVVTAPPGPAVPGPAVPGPAVPGPAAPLPVAPPGAASPPVQAASAGLAAAGRAAQRRRPRNDALPTRPPYPGLKVLRMGLALLLGAMAVTTLAGGVLMLLLWREGSEAGILDSQVERTWDLFDRLRTIETLIVYLTVPLAAIWAALAAVNACRVTSRRAYAALGVLTLPPAIWGAWVLAVEVVEPADGAVGIAAGIAVQSVVLAVPILAFEYVAGLVDARRRPFRVAYLIAVLLLVHIQVRGALSTIAVTFDAAEWGRLAAYLVIAALLQVLGALAVNEGCRSIEEAAQYRFEMRRAFSGSVLARA